MDAATLLLRHQLRHGDRKPAKYDGASIHAWVAMAHECGMLRCPIFRSECEDAGPHAQDVFPAAFTPPVLDEPGQLATYLGGMMRLLTPTVQPRQEVKWWRHMKPLVTEAPRCADEQRCPDCADGNPCPLDVAHEYAAASLLRENTGEITDKRIRDVIMNKGRGDGYLAKWTKAHPELAGHVAYLAIKHTEDTGDHGSARAYYDDAAALGLHTIEPMLALRHAQDQANRGRASAGADFLRAALRSDDSRASMRSLTAALAALGEVKVSEAHPGRPARPQQRVRRRRFST